MRLRWGRWWKSKLQGGWLKILTNAPIPHVMMANRGTLVLA